MLKGWRMGWTQTVRGQSGTLRQWLRLRALLGGALVLLAQGLSADMLTIEITEGVDQPVSIAVVPFAGAMDDGLDVAQIVRNNLRRSGRFRAIEPEDMLSSPQNATQVVYRDWRLIGAEYLLVGVVEGTVDGRQRVTYELFSVLQGKRLRGEMLTSSATQLRNLAHRISDQVYAEITGIEGIFATRILYITEVGVGDERRYRLNLADADGYNARVILESVEPIMSPVWAPGGERIAYVSFETGAPAIYVQELSSGVRERVTHWPGINSAPDFSPDGKQLAMVLSKDGNPEIYLLHLESRQLRRVTDHFAIDTEPRFTPDGRALLFTSGRGGRPQVYRVDLASGRVQRVSFQGDYNARPIPLPDGRSVVMVHRRDGVFHIAVQDLERGNVRVLTDTSLDESPSVAPNGELVLYATQSRGRGILAAVSVDGKVKFRLPSSTGDVREPAWSPLTP